MDGAAFGLLIMFVHSSLSDGLTGDNICVYNDIHVK